MSKTKLNTNQKLSLIFLVLITLFFVYCQKDLQQTPTASHFLNLQDSTRYVGMQTCRSCHQDVYDTFIHTGMGKSFDHATLEKSAARFGKHALVYDKKSDFYYKPYFQDSILYIKEFRLENGDTIHQRTEKISYIVGSGQHTNSHILNFNGYIFQAPITYYTQEERWDMAPGFNRENQRFSRLLTTECITCHNHFPAPVEGSMNKYEAMPSGIECERCHGPGEIHVKEKLAGELVDTSQNIDYSIVNPRHLPRDLQMDLCQLCHLQGIAVAEEGKTFFDFKPGMKLSEVMNVFLPRYTDSHEKFIMASQADRLRMSPCYLQSQDLTCITCHNPHQSVTTTNQTQYNNTCINCHQEKKCTEQTAKRLAINDNCVSCHMPKTGSIDIPHVNITDHYISKTTVQSQESIPEKEKKAIAKFLGLQILTKDKPSPQDMARGYIALFDKYVATPQMLDSAKYYLDKITSGDKFKTQIHYYFARENYDMITKLVDNTISINMQDGWTAYRIGEAYYKKQNYQRALLFYKKAIEQLPYHLDFQEKLGATYIALDYQREAKQTFDFVLSENPKRKVALNNLGYLKVLQKKFKEGEKYYNQALALDPDYEQALLSRTVTFAKR